MLTETLSSLTEPNKGLVEPIQKLKGTSNNLRFERGIRWV